MSLRLLQLHPISTSHYYTSGDVTIEPGVAIAPGVLLQADSDSRILIRAGACIGIGAVLHAHAGAIEIGAGANIGAEVLLVGQVEVGANACIGVATTVFNSNVGAGQIIPPGSLITVSDDSQELEATDTVIYPSIESPQLTTTNGAGVAVPETAQPSNINVYGQVYVNRMFFKLFPNDPRSDQQLNQSSGDDPWND